MNAGIVALAGFTLGMVAAAMVVALAMRDWWRLLQFAVFAGLLFWFIADSVKEINSITGPAEASTYPKGS